MLIYLAGPMRGLPFFNFPAFDAAAEKLRSEGHVVFNPADRDREEHGDTVSDSPTGNLDDIKDTGFNLREALHADTSFICLEAEAIALLPGWMQSRGATAEYALARALDLEVFLLDD